MTTGATDQIERDEEIQFHKEGTLLAVTRWISSHDEGIAEWLKNARSAYNRTSVDDSHRVALLLLKDQNPRGPARIGLLDTGGATLEDVVAFSTWQDLQASSRGAPSDEGNQGNGGKAYMFRLFEGPARIVGVRDGKRNVKGFFGAAESVQRGTPGFMPSAAEGREVPIASWRAELNAALSPYGLRFEDLPAELGEAIAARQAFTLVEGVDPVGLYKGRIDADDLLARVLRHDQATLAVQQIRVYAQHNGVRQNGGRPLELEAIPPYPDLEGPFVYPIPDDLQLPAGEVVSTTEGGRRGAGRLILFTSKENMPNAYKKLKPRWKMTYRTSHQVIGSKSIGDLVPTTPGAVFIYGVVELPAFDPTYVEHGRRHPKPGPLTEAVDAFVSVHLRELARQINERRRRDLDDRVLDTVHQENKLLDEFKNKFLTSEGLGDGGEGDNGKGPRRRLVGGVAEYGKVPQSIAVDRVLSIVRVARGMRLRLSDLLQIRVKDDQGRTVPHVALDWRSTDPNVATFISGDELEAKEKGSIEVSATVRGTSITSQPVTIQVWAVDHVLLTPRSIEIALGKSQRITAEVTDEDGSRSSDVLLDWRHDADDQLVVRIGPAGIVTGNRVGRTAITAGAGDPGTGGVWARIPVDATVIPNPEQPERGGGFPRLLLTGRDIDPSTNAVREGNPDAPALWQEAADYVNNVWWLNLQSPEAAFAFAQHESDPKVWRTFHVQKVMEMVAHVYMQEQFTKRGDEERPDYWANHRLAAEAHQVRIVGQMWGNLESYVEAGGALE